MKATFLKGVALGAVVSLATLMATAAFAGTGVGGLFNLGAVNTVNAGTGLSGSVNGNMLGVKNTNTGASAGGLGISVAPGKAPLTVNSATQVKNLNASYLQGLKASQFHQGPGSTHGATLFVPNTGFTGMGAVGSFGGLTAYCGSGGFADAGVKLDTAKAQNFSEWSSDGTSGFGTYQANQLYDIAANTAFALETVRLSSGPEVATLTIAWGLHFVGAMPTGDCDFSVQVVDSVG